MYNIVFQFKAITITYQNSNSIVLHFTFKISNKKLIIRFIYNSSSIIMHRLKKKRHAGAF